MQSPNRGGVRPHTYGVVLHSTRGGASSYDAEYRAKLNHFASRASQVSAHAVVGPNGEADFPVADDLEAWHAEEHNKTHLGIELVQPKPGDPIPEPTLRRAAQIVKGWQAKYGFPLQWSTESGLAEHREMPQGKRVGKSDVGPPFDQGAFLRMVGGSSSTDPAPALLLVGAVALLLILDL